MLFGTDFRTEGVTESRPGDETDSPSSSTIMTYDEVVEQIKAAYQNAKTSAQNGNWADYGRYLDQLEQAISQLDKAGSSSSDNTDNSTDTNADADSQNSTESATAEVSADADMTV